MFKNWDWDLSKWHKELMEQSERSMESEDTNKPSSLCTKQITERGLVTSTTCPVDGISMVGC